jgi:hypothetical protein
VKPQILHVKHFHSHSTKKRHWSPIKTPIIGHVTDLAMLFPSFKGGDSNYTQSYVKNDHVTTDVAGYHGHWRVVLISNKHKKVPSHNTGKRAYHALCAYLIGVNESVMMVWEPAPAN